MEPVHRTCSSSFNFQSQEDVSEAEKIRLPENVKNVTDHFFDKARGYLEKNRIIDSELNVYRKDLPFPFLTSNVLLALFDELVKMRTGKTLGSQRSSAQKFEFSILELYELVRDDVHEVEIVGSTVFQLLGLMLDDIFRVLGVPNYEEFLQDEIRKIWKIEPPDVDIRLILSNIKSEWEMKEFSKKIKNFLALKLPQEPHEGKIDFFHKYGLIKFHAKYGNQNQFSMLSVGDREGKSVEVICKVKLKRESFLIQDSLSLLVKKFLNDLLAEKGNLNEFKERIKNGQYDLKIRPSFSQGDPWGPVVQRSTGMLKGTDLKGINHLGWGLIISHWAKGKRCYDAELENTLFENLRKWVARKNKLLFSEIVTSLEKVLSNHHKQGSATAVFAVTLNACIALIRHNPQISLDVWKVMAKKFDFSEESFIKKVCAHMRQVHSAEEVCALLQLEALFSLGEAKNEIRLIAHEGQVSCQIQVGSSFILFFFQPLAALDQILGTSNTYVLEYINNLVLTSTFSPYYVVREELKAKAILFLNHKDSRLQTLGCLLLLGCEKKQPVQGESSIKLAIDLAARNKEELSLLAYKLWENLNPKESDIEKFFNTILSSRPDLAAELLCQKKATDRRHILALQRVYAHALKNRHLDKYVLQIIQKLEIILNKFSGGLCSNSSKFISEICEKYLDSLRLSTILTCLLKIQKREFDGFTWWKIAVKSQDVVRIWELLQKMNVSLTAQHLDELLPLYQKVEGLPTSCWIQLIRPSLRLDSKRCEVLSVIKEKQLFKELDVFLEILPHFETSEDLSKYIYSKAHPLESLKLCAQCILFFLPEISQNDRSILKVLDVLLSGKGVESSCEWKEFISLLDPISIKIKKLLPYKVPEAFYRGYIACLELLKVNPELVLQLWQAYLPLFDDSKDPILLFSIEWFKKENPQTILTLIQIQQFVSGVNHLFPHAAFELLKGLLEKDLPVFDAFWQTLKPKSLTRNEEINGFIQYFWNLKSKSGKCMACALELANKSSPETINGTSPQSWAAALVQENNYEKIYGLWKLLNTTPQEGLKFVEAIANMNRLLAVKFLRTDKKKLKNLVSSAIWKIFRANINSFEDISSVVFELLSLIPLKKEAISSDSLNLLDRLFKFYIGKKDWQVLEKILALTLINSKESEYSELINKLWTSWLIESVTFTVFNDVWELMQKANIRVVFTKEDVHYLCENSEKNTIPTSCWIMLIHHISFFQDQRLQQKFINLLINSFSKIQEKNDVIVESIKLLKTPSAIQKIVFTIFDKANGEALLKRILSKKIEEDQEKNFSLVVNLFEAYVFVPFNSEELSLELSHHQSALELLARFKGVSPRLDFIVHFLENKEIKKNNPPEIFQEMFDALVEHSIQEGFWFFPKRTKFFKSNPQFVSKLASSLQKKLMHQNLYQGENCKKFIEILCDFYSSEINSIIDSALKAMINQAQDYQHLCEVLPYLQRFANLGYISLEVILTLIKQSQNCLFNLKSFNTFVEEFHHLVLGTNPASFPITKFFSPWVESLISRSNGAAISWCWRFIESTKLCLKNPTVLKGDLKSKFERKIFELDDVEFKKFCFLSRLDYCNLITLSNNVFMVDRKAFPENAYIFFGLFLENAKEVNDVASFVSLLEVFSNKIFYQFNASLTSKYWIKWLNQFFDYMIQHPLISVKFLHAEILREGFDESYCDELDSFIRMALPKLTIEHAHNTNAETKQIFFDFLYNSREKLKNETSQHISEFTSKWLQNLASSGHINRVISCMKSTVRFWLTSNDQVEIYLCYAEHEFQLCNLNPASQFFLEVYNSDPDTCSKNEYFKSLYWSMLDTLLHELCNFELGYGSIFRAYEFLALPYVEKLIEIDDEVENVAQRVVKFLNLTSHYNSVLVYSIDIPYVPKILESKNSGKMVRTTFEQKRAYIQNIAKKIGCESRVETLNISGWEDNVKEYSEKEYLKKHEFQEVRKFIWQNFSFREKECLEFTLKIFEKYYNKQQHWECSTFQLFELWYIGLQLYKWMAPLRGRVLFDSIPLFNRILETVDLPYRIALFSEFLDLFFLNSKIEEFSKDCLCEIENIYRYISSLICEDVDQFSLIYIMEDIKTTLACVYSLSSEIDSIRKAAKLLDVIDYSKILLPSQKKYIFVLEKLIDSSRKFENIEDQELMFAQVADSMDKFRLKAYIGSLSPYSLIKVAIKTGDPDLLDKVCFIVAREIKIIEVNESPVFISECFLLLDKCCPFEKNSKNFSLGALRLLVILMYRVKDTKQFQSFAIFFFDRAIKMISNETDPTRRYKRSLSLISGFFDMSHNDQALFSHITGQAVKLLTNCYLNAYDDYENYLSEKIWQQIESTFQSICDRGEDPLSKEQEGSKAEYCYDALRGAILGYELNVLMINSLNSNAESELFKIQTMAKFYTLLLRHKDENMNINKFNKLSRDIQSLITKLRNINCNDLIEPLIRAVKNMYVPQNDPNIILAFEVFKIMISK